METLEKSINLSRIECDGMKNPLMRQIIEKYNKYSQQGILCSEMVRKYSKGSHSKHSKGGGGGCYITTACLDAIGLPRDSLEMKAMEVLTKEHILKSFQGKKDYVIYGRKAPLIVQAIKSRDDSQDVWKRVYGTLRNITSAVLSSDNERAHKQYKDLVLGLEKEYLGV